MYTDLAWECLRRNPDYIREWNKVRTKYQVCSIQEDYDLVASTNWGLLKFNDPFDKSAQNVFWDYRYSKRSLRVKIEAPSEQVSNFRLEGRGGNFQKKTLILLNGERCIKLYDEHNYIQLFVSGLNDDELLKKGTIYLEINNYDTSSLKRLLDFLLFGLGCQIWKKEIIKSLTVYDLALNGMTHKQIASSIYGEHIAHTEWSSDGWLRARIRYKLKKAQEAIMGGHYIYL